MERENYISDVQEYWQYIQNGGSRSVKNAVRDTRQLPPNQSYQDDWEPWGVDHHQQPPYSDRTFYDDSWYEHTHPQWFHDDHHSYQHYDHYDEPSSYSRSRERLDFHNRGRYHDRFTPYHRERNTRYTPTPDHYYSHQPLPNYQRQPLLKPNRGVHKKY